MILYMIFDMFYIYTHKLYVFVLLIYISNVIELKMLMSTEIYILYVCIYIYIYTHTQYFFLYKFNDKYI